MDVFSTVVGLVIAGIALFVGYRIGVRDGFGGGVHTGRVMERQHAEQERRFLLARAIRAEAALEARPSATALPSPAHTPHFVDNPDYYEGEYIGADPGPPVRDRSYPSRHEDF